jgi:hypothetical protein
MRSAAVRTLAPLLMLLAAATAPLAIAKLPAPVLSDEAKAKAAEAAAKTAWGNKVADFQLCKSMDKAAAKYHAAIKAAGKEVKVTKTPPCADPGPLVASPPAAAPTAAPTAAPAAAPATKS